MSRRSVPCDVLGSFTFSTLVVEAGEAGPQKDVEAEVASAFDPVVVLFGQKSSDQADQGVTGREDAHRVNPDPDPLVESFS